ncbi:MAG: hypothetical protein HY590_00105 [Candidatus Omnitrophica bacterium]|nr:hypothetical protein [Candidatus Omnitrophota bacterium]
MAKAFPLKCGVSYFGNYFLNHFRKDLQEIVRGGCHFIVLTFSEQDLQYYPGTLKDFVKASHDADLEVYLDPWAVGRVFGGESYSEFLVHHPEARQVSSVGKILPIACPNHPVFQKFLKNWCDAGFDCKTDTFFWDEPHFYIFKGKKEKELWACRCPVCQKLFSGKFGKPMPKTLTEEVLLFREETVVRFLKKFCDYTKQEGFRNAVCLLPQVYSIHTLQDWSPVARIKSLDVLGTDPYWHAGVKDVEGLVRHYARQVFHLCLRYGKEPQVWVLNFKIKKGEEEKIGIALEAAYEEGVRNFAAWSYQGTGQMSCLKSDDPEKVWRTLTRTYLTFQKRK